MTTKKIIIAVSVVLVLFLAGYLIYSQLIPKPTPVEQKSDERIAAEVSALLQESDAAIKIFRTSDNDLILVDRDKMTLYSYEGDTAEKSNCTGVCAENWPPLVVASIDSLTIGSGISKSAISTVPRNGSLQITYRGRLLYRRLGDKIPGDMTGKEFKNWNVVKL